MPNNRYRLAAEQGHADSQHDIGWLYAEGKGVPKSSETAVQWYRMSAKQGNARAQCSLGFMYEYGAGVEKSFEEAAKYYRLSADQGNASAQRNLAIFYENGRGVERYLGDAIKYYRLSADNGNLDAKKDLKRLTCEVEIFRSPGVVFWLETGIVLGVQAKSDTYSQTHSSHQIVSVGNQNSVVNTPYTTVHTNNYNEIWYDSDGNQEKINVDSSFGVLSGHKISIIYSRPEGVDMSYAMKIINNNTDKGYVFGYDPNRNGKAVSQSFFFKHLDFLSAYCMNPSREDAMDKEIQELYKEEVLLLSRDRRAKLIGFCVLCVIVAYLIMKQH